MSRFFRRWAILIGVVSLLAGAAAYAFVQSQPPRYRAAAVLQIGSYMALTNPDPQMIRSAATFAQTYIARLQTEDVLSAIQAQHAPDLSLEALRNAFSATFAEGTSLLSLTVLDGDPERAATLANAFADQITAISPSERLAFQEEQFGYLQAELRRLQTRLSRASQELEVIELSMTQPDLSAEDRSVLFARRAELAQEVQALQSSLATLLGTLEAFQNRGEVNTVQRVGRARPPSEPISTAAGLIAVFAAFLSGGLVFGLALIFEGLNDGVRGLDELMPIFNAPILGLIPPFGQKAVYADKLVTWHQPRLAAAEAYHALRLNLTYRMMALNAPSRLWVITSPSVGTGKSVTAANLAVALAMNGARVILIDANLRAGSLHHILGMENHNGLSNIWQSADLARVWLPIGTDRALISNDAAENAFRQRVRLFLSALIQPTYVPNLEVITVGAPHSTPSELLASPQMHELVRQLIVEYAYDLILFDTPALSESRDALLLSKTFHAKPLLVLEAGRARRRVLAHAARQLAAYGAPAFGIVVNRHPTEQPMARLPFSAVAPARQISAPKD
jgi:Mrp family chromosome partitioning ATPase/capsular polysaccharide biosynthesis protein